MHIRLAKFISWSVDTDDSRGRFSGTRTVLLAVGIIANIVGGTNVVALALISIGACDWISFRLVDNLLTVDMKKLDVYQKQSKNIYHFEVKRKQ